MTPANLTILISGMIAGDPCQGGATWAVLQYVLGFRKLGHEVYFVEQVEGSRLRPSGAPLHRSENARYFSEVITDFGLGENSSLWLAGTSMTVGLSYPRIREAASRADVLINLSGTLSDQEWTNRIPLRVYLDLDPAFTQLWQSVEGIDMRLSGHTHFFSVGQALGEADCTIPTCGVRWSPTLQPVVLPYWPPANGIVYDALTTVANWRGYGSILHDGVFYGQKAHGLRPFISLPALSRESFLLALAIHPDEAADLEALTRCGWRLLDPMQVASTPSSYQRFVQGSRAELGIAKSGYVVSRCGWFADRSACYLASGRPVIAQETGFSRYLPTGSGLFAFTTMSDILESLEELSRDYGHHACSARAIAEEHFESGKVLHRLLRIIGATG